MKISECALELWELGECPKLQLPFGQVAEKAAEVIYSLGQLADTIADYELKRKILGIQGEVTEIPTILRDAGFDDGAMERHTAILEAIHWVPDRSELLASLRPKTEARRKHHDL